jgi:alkylated DNA repair protein (DNA oxidative demethylase)
MTWGGPARLAFHGVDTLAEAPLVVAFRYSLTFRRAGR